MAGVVIGRELASAAARHGMPRAAAVALESTIVAHGMQFPQNLDCARSVEGVVRRGGGVPATVAVLDGVPVCGLDDAALERLGRDGAASFSKLSRRDLAWALGTSANGATTVSGTAAIAAQAGVEVFVTGGVGGVHRGGELSWDVSADLTELGRTHIAVVCAGAKSILDIPRTLEVLETEGVAVVGYQTDEFPAYVAASACTCPSCRDMS